MTHLRHILVCSIHPGKVVGSAAAGGRRRRRWPLILDLQPSIKCPLILPSSILVSLHGHPSQVLQSFNNHMVTVSFYRDFLPNRSNEATDDALANSAGRTLPC